MPAAKRRVPSMQTTASISTREEHTAIWHPLLPVHAIADSRAAAEDEFPATAVASAAGTAVGPECGILEQVRECGTDTAALRRLLLSAAGT
jgi:hypothetical protein